MMLWNAVQKVWRLFTDFKNTTLGIVGKAQTIVSGVETEFNAIKNFQYEPHWRTRVISVPRAIDATQAFFTEVPDDIISSVRDIISLVKDKIEPTEFNLEEIKFLPTKIARVLEKILGFVSLIVDTLVTIDQLFDDLNKIVDAARRIREEIEGLDTLFLPQGRPKTTGDFHYRKRGV